MERCEGNVQCLDGKLRRGVRWILEGKLRRGVRWMEMVEVEAVGIVFKMKQ